MKKSVAIRWGNAVIRVFVVFAEFQSASKSLARPQQHVLNSGAKANEAQQLLHGNTEHLIHHGKHADHIEFRRVLIQYRRQRFAKRRAF
jgi:hypothetical protein